MGWDMIVRPVGVEPSTGLVWTSVVRLVVEIIDLGQTGLHCPTRGAERRGPAEIRGHFITQVGKARATWEPGCEATGR